MPVSRDPIFRYGGHDDYFLFLQRVFEQLDHRRFVAVGAQELARLAVEANPKLGKSPAPTMSTVGVAAVKDR